MAQPAWVVRSRRERTRSRTRSAARAVRRPHVYAPASVRDRQRNWLGIALYPLSLRSPVAAQATAGARAILHGYPFPAAGAPAPRLPRLRIAFPAMDRCVSLRFAAHCIILVIVLLVVLSAPYTPAVHGGLPVQLKQNAIPDGGDLYVQRAPEFSPPAADQTTALPALRGQPAELTLPYVESYVVAEGETLGQIASQYGISVASLFWANDLESVDVFSAGQDMRIPRVNGVPYIVADGDTLDSIAEQFGVSADVIVILRANGVSENRPLPIGHEIFIPGGTQPFPQALLDTYQGEAGIADMRAVAAAVVQESDTNLREGPSRDYARLGRLDAGRRLKLLARHGDWVKVADNAGTTGWIRSDLLGLVADTIAGLQETDDFPPPPPRWIWPTKGAISSTFGWRRIPYRSFHDGLDIANRAGTNIFAARTGRVIEAGWCSGFGYCVKIDHGDGMVSIYGHMLKRPPVRVGAAVEAGDLIGLMGSTYDRAGGGYSTGVHLHFTIKVNGKAVDPRKFLP